MKDKLLHILFLWAVWLTLPACSDRVEEPEPDSSIKVSLGITTRAVEQEGKEVGDGFPQSLKVWIYGVKGSEEVTLLAYIEEDATDESQIFNDGTDIYGNPIEVIEQELEEGKKYEALNFYVVLNDKAVTWADNASLDKNTTSGQLKAMTFSLSTVTSAPTTDNEQLMYGESDLEIVPSKTHYEVEIPVERSVAKMELYFTKNDADKSLTINSITLDSKVAKGYLVEKDVLEDIYETTSESKFLFTNTDGNGVIDCSSTENYGDFSTDEANFKRLIAPFLLENEAGLDWKENAPDETYPEATDNVENAYVVEVNYIYDNVEKIKEFCLPQIKRNVWYKIYVRVRDLDWLVSVCPYGSVDLRPSFGLDKE